MVFDKTGTLTQGVFEVTGIHHSAPWRTTGCWNTPPWRRAPPPTPSARASRGPMAGDLDRSRVTDIQEISRPRRHGQGGRHHRGRGQRQAHGPAGHRLAPPATSVGTIIHVAMDGRYAGHIVISDVVKPDCQGGHRRPEGRRGATRPSCSPATGPRWPSRWPGAWAWTRCTAELLPADKVDEGGAAAGAEAAQGKAGLCGGRHQRRPGPLPGGHRHRHGGHGLRRGHRGRRRGPDGRRPPEDRQGHPDLPQVPAASSTRTSSLPSASRWSAWCWWPWASPICGWPSSPTWA